MRRARVILLFSFVVLLNFHPASAADEVGARISYLDLNDGPIRGVKNLTFLAASIGIFAQTFG